MGSLLGCSCVFQESSHVQQSILYSLGKLGGVSLLAAVEGCDGDVDVIIHGIVTHSIAIWHHWTKAHHTVCLGSNLDTKTVEMRAHTQVNKYYLVVKDFLNVFIYLAGGELIMESHGKRGIHEYLRQRGQVFNTLHPQTEKVSVYGLSVNGLKREAECVKLRCIGCCKRKTDACVDAHVVRVLLVCLDSLVQQWQLL